MRKRSPLEPAKEGITETEAGAGAHGYRLPSARPLEPAHEESLARAIQGGSDAQRNAAINELVEAHLPLAKPFARGAMRQPSEFEDLMNEAVLILRRAAERFLPGSGNRFSSYAMAALKRELWRQSPSLIGVTRHSGGQVREFDRAQHDLAQKHGRSVTIDEVYEQLQCPERTRTEIENVRRILSGKRRRHVNGDGALSDPEDVQLPDPCRSAVDNETTERLRRAFGTLSGLEKRVLVGHCILGHSDRQMAKRLRRSPATLKGVRAGALAKLAQLVDPSRPARKAK